MARANKFLAFRVALNDQQLVTAGIAGSHVVSVIVSSVLREPGYVSPAGQPMPERELALQVGGLISKTREHVDWGDVPLAIGDRITLEVIETRAADAPLSRRPPREKATPKARARTKQTTERAKPAKKAKSRRAAKR